MEKHSEQAHGILQTFISDGTPAAIEVRYASLPAIAAESDFGDLDRNIVVIDTQIAAARMEQGRIVDWFITFVNPGKPIPEDVAYLTDIHDEDVADAPLPSEALSELVEFVGDAKIVAHNAEFDRSPPGIPVATCCWRTRGSIRSTLRASHSRV